MSINSSGKIPKISKIPILKNKYYYVKEFELDGDAPKQFIHAYIYGAKSAMRRKNLRTWIPYIAKTAEKYYPHESIIEYMLNRIGEVVGLNMNQTKLFVISGQIRFLSRYFLSHGEVMIHGAEICGEYLDDRALAIEIAENRKNSRDLFTFQFILRAMKNVFTENYEELTTEFVKMLVFDAIVGNNDRHFYNWAVIRRVDKVGKKPYFAPIYDTARGLFWNWSDGSVKESLKNYKKGGRKVENYLQNALPRVSIEENAEINHFDLVGFLCKENKLYNKIVVELTSAEVEAEVVKMIKNEFDSFFVKERMTLIILTIQRRFSQLRKEAND